MSKLTYSDFTRTGWQDCSNVFDIDGHHDAWRRLGKPRGAAAARAVVRTAWGDDDGVYESWLEGVDVDEVVESGLELRRAYAAWRDAWQDCAESAMKAYIKEWIKHEEEDQ